MSRYNPFFWNILLTYGLYELEYQYGKAGRLIGCSSSYDLVAEYKDDSKVVSASNVPVASTPTQCKHKWVNCSFSENPDDASYACKYCGVAKEEADRWAWEELLQAEVGRVHKIEIPDTWGFDDLSGCD
jgi:hypothetical protein